MATDTSARKQELLDILASGTTDKKAFDELMALNLAEEKFKAERSKRVAALIDAIHELGVTFAEIRPAFSAAELRDVRSSKPRAAPKARVSRRSGEALIANLKTAAGKGAASNYHKGQAIPQYVPKAFKELYANNKENFEEALKPYFTKPGKAYFATKEGRVELDAWMAFVKNGKISPK
jgi:hypothetical protein